MSKWWYKGFLLLMLLTAGCQVGQKGMYANSFPSAGVDSAGFYLGRRLHHFVASLAPHSFSGSVVVEREGEYLLKDAYGYASWAEQQAFKTATVSHSGQLAQQFSAAAILKLAAQEKLNLTDPLSQFFEDLSEVKKEITLDQLLRHTSGFPADIPAANQPLMKEQFLQALLQHPLEAKPGEAYQYSEAGYRLLAAVVEKVSGKTYEEYISQYLLKPAGLKKTGYLTPDFEQEKAAAALGEILSQEESLPDYEKMAPALWHMMGSSGLLTTAEDIHHWQKKLLSGKVLSPAFLERIWSNREKVPEGASAYGWVLEVGTEGNPVLLHNSGQGSYRSQLYASPEEEIFISLLSNKANFQVERLSHQLARSLKVPAYIPTPVPYREQKFIRLPQGEETIHLRALLEFVQEEEVVQPVELITKSYSPAFSEAVPPHQHKLALTQLRSYLKGAFLEKINRTGPLYSLMLHQPEEDRWFLLRVETEPLAPHRLSMIELEPTSPL